jgi:hypothetical protein
VNIQTRVAKGDEEAVCVEPQNPYKLLKQRYFGLSGQHCNGQNLAASERTVVRIYIQTVLL